jgi:transketolase
LCASDVDTAIREAKADTEHPSLIICDTVIGYGSPNKADTSKAHGEPLGQEEAALSKKQLGWPYTEPFIIPDAVLSHFREAIDTGRKKEAGWDQLFEAYAKEYPSEAQSFKDNQEGKLAEGWARDLESLFNSDMRPLATREASGIIINALAPKVSSLMGGSADLAPSNKTLIKNGGDFSAQDYAGRNIHFGIREHAMGAIANGMALHSGIVPYTATFLVFSDYMKPPIRMAALMHKRVVFIFTHDSIGLGEDGPTHQPVEQLVGLRSIPNLTVIRPADATETSVAWKLALEQISGPCALILSRQSLPVLNRNLLSPVSGVQKGGYILWQCSEKPEVILIGTGSEVHIALEAGRMLKEKGISARVVSLPSWEIFDSQDEEYRRFVLPPEIKARVSIEAGSTFGWERYVGEQGTAIGIDHFGASAPGNVLYEKFGITAGKIADAATRLLGKTC